MKIAKKLAGLLLSASIVAGLLVAPASAAGTGGLSVDKALAKAGDTIVVTSEIPAISGEATTVTIKFNYDPTKLEYVSNDFAENKFTISDGGTPLGNSVNHQPVSTDDDGAAAGVVAYTVTVSGGYVDLSQGHKMTATFKVKNDATPGETTLKYKMTQLLIKNKTESFVPTDWSTSAKVEIITDYIDTVAVSGVAVETGVALPTAANLTATGLSADTAAITWDPTDITAEDKDYNFSIALNALKNDTQEYRFAETVTVTGLENFAEVTATPSEDGATLTITGKYLSRMLGDVNGDDAVDILDIQQILNYLAGEESVLDQDAVAMKVADVNSDNSVDILDIQQILNYLAGEESVFD